MWTAPGHRPRARARVARCAWSPRRTSSRPSSPPPAVSASAKSTIQILSHVLLRAEDGRCELASTDMELSLRVPLAGDGRGARRRRAAAPGRRHRAQHGRRPRHARAPRQRGRSSRSSGGGSSFSLNCLQAHDFPELPADEGSGLTLPSEPLVGGDRPGGPCRVARRDAPGPDRRAAAPGARRPDDGGDRLLPPGGARRHALDAPPADAREAIVPARALDRGVAAAPAWRRPSRSRWCSPRPRRCSGSATCASRAGSSRASSRTTASSCPTPSSTTSRSTAASCSGC